MDPAGLVNIRPLSGADLDAALPALARLRIEVFRAYPYLYAGSLAYEETYLRKFAQAKDAFIVAAETEDGEIVGCATGSGMDDQHAEFALPLSAAGYDLPTTFYFGESVLLPDWRGKGIGHAFFDAREAHAIAHSYKRACFCAVERPDDHPQRPETYSPLDSFWQSRGYRKLPGVTAHFTWPEAPGEPEVNHTMVYWLRQF
ncbi:GNAT family N-acetyltransferase [Hyphomonas sp.]|uniref:GNAT family N-acetyltransferase n=1 Tax=Hyphomonas sp. TaxID=87 RepID=UPI000C605C64|nr:GNAT family N-acetyltransferase [Hyphomonas sp.]MAB10592.1 GNAT family N-acetyltransferase [Hyphomonas sp.]MAU67938.1 GNAT family N-acetyltransferase [Hyphomonas sp.]MBM58998.1 GNAT family N-acetyltransferase [Hyphomonas sp.]